MTTPTPTAVPIPEDLRREELDPARKLLSFIDASPSPWHAGANLSAMLLAAGFERLAEADPWRLDAGRSYFLSRGDASVIAFRVGSQRLIDSGIRLLVAHTDSPGLRVKPRGPHHAEGWMRVGVEIYGGPILATFTDRDLSLAGRLHLRDASGVKTVLLRFDAPLLRLPNLAIHMNRTVNEDGLKLAKQTELPLLLGAAEGEDPRGRFAGLLAERASVDAAAILSFELAAYDTQPGAFWGAEQEFIASARLDNLASCHAGVAALLSVEQPTATCLAGFFDHEEVGSGSAKGADSSFLTSTVERIGEALGLSQGEVRQALARSFLISADMAHAYQPNFPAAYEPQHTVKVNAGPVIKTNVNQRYATCGRSEAQFIALCEAAGVPFQQYTHRTDLGCGSTIGPMSAARLGVPAVDVGSPMWAMHSIRESAGAHDHRFAITVFGRFFREEGLGSSF